MCVAVSYRCGESRDEKPSDLNRTCVWPTARVGRLFQRGFSAMCLALCARGAEPLTRDGAGEYIHFGFVAVSDQARDAIFAALKVISPLTRDGAGELGQGCGG
jgi:hypothetical protein